MTDLKPFLAKAASREPLTRDEARAAFDILMSGQATPSQIGGFLMALRVRGETVDEIVGAVTAMRSKMLTVEAPADAIDIVGTGGDASGTYNISTLAALIVAGAGVPVAKHGNRALSSKSGAADNLAALGVKLDVGPEIISRCIAEAGVGFMAAYRNVVMRIVPAGLSRSEVTAAISLSMCSKAGRRFRSIRSPALVSDKLRVVREISRTPSLCSSILTE